MEVVSRLTRGINFMNLKSMLRRIFAATLAVILLITALPDIPIVKADNQDWTDYIQISTKAELDSIRNNLSGQYCLAADIVFTENDFAQGGDFFNAGAGWSPIGTDYNNPFTGIFDGNGHTISGLHCNINSSTTVYFGLLGYNKGSILNVGLLNGSISDTSTSSYAYAGGIVGFNDHGTISNCSSKGSVEATPSCQASTGGIVGYNNYGIINNCYNSGIVRVAAASYYSSNSNTGGIAGLNNGTISNCYNTGSISASSSSSYRDYTGGIAGYNAGTVSNCYNVGSVIDHSSYSFDGGITGYTNSCAISNCYYLNIISSGIGSGSGTSQALSLDQMKQQSYFEGFDFTDIWAMSPNYLPYLQAIPYVELTSMAFLKSTAQVATNGSYQTQLTLDPTIPMFINVQYTSLDTGVASVDEYGLIKSVKPGITNIIAKDLVTGKTAVCTITVLQLGDMTGDNKVSSVDALLVLQAVSGRRTLTPKQMILADVNADGNVTAADALMILQYVSGRVKDF